MNSWKEFPDIIKLMNKKFRLNKVISSLTSLGFKKFKILKKLNMELIVMCLNLKLRV